MRFDWVHFLVVLSCFFKAEISLLPFEAAGRLYILLRARDYRTLKVGVSVRIRLYWMSGALVAAALAASTASAQSSSPAREEWEKHETAALAEGRGCYASKDVDACKRMLAAYALALKSPDAGEQAREQVVGAMLGVYAAAAKTAREKGDARGSLNLLEDGQKLIVDHYASGSHWHIAFDASELLVETVKTLWELGLTKEMAVTLANVRGTQDGIFKGVSDQPCSEDQQNARMYMIGRVVNFERELDRFAKDAPSTTSEGKPAVDLDVDVLIRLSADASERATRFNLAAPSRSAPVDPQICKFVGSKK